MPDITLYDAYGKPVQKNVLTQETARPSLTGVRSIWNHNQVTGGLTPQRLASLLKRAAEGEADDYLTLAEEMEEKDLHYASVLGTRKRAVARLPIVIVTGKHRDWETHHVLSCFFRQPFFHAHLPINNFFHFMYF